MAVEEAIIQGVNLTGTQISETLSALPGISNLIRIGQIAGVIVIFYFIFLIVKGFFQFRQNLKMNRLLQQVTEINKKMDQIIRVKAKVSTKSSKSKSKK